MLRCCLSTVRITGGYGTTPKSIGMPLSGRRRSAATKSGFVSNTSVLGIPQVSGIDSTYTPLDSCLDPRCIYGGYSEPFVQQLDSGSINPDNELVPQKSSVTGKPHAQPAAEGGTPITSSGPYPFILSLSRNLIKYRHSAFKIMGTGSSSELDKRDIHMPDAAVIAKIRQYISPDNHVSAVGRSPNAIRALYLAAKHRLSLCLFSDAELSMLINLFGTLSLSTSESIYHSIHAYPLKKNIDFRNQRTYWPFVVSVVADKAHLGHKLQPSDHFWIMRARLAELRLSAVECRDGANEGHSTIVTRALREARKHYQRICHDTAHPDVHVPYLEALLSRRQPAYLREAVRRICALLSEHCYCHSRLLTVLRRIILMDNLTSEMREMILSALWRRISKRVVGIAHVPCVGSPANARVPANMSTIIASFTTVVFHSGFNPISSKPPQTHLDHWTYGIVASIFDPMKQIGVDDRWVSLVLLVLTSTSGNETGPHAMLAQDERRNAAVIYWQVMCGLQLLETVTEGMNTYRSPPATEQGIDGIRNILQSLWNDWSSIHRSDVPQWPPIERTICTTFLRLAGRVGEVVVKDACFAYCTMHDLWQTDQTTSPSDTIALSVECFITFIACGDSVRSAARVLLQPLIDGEIRSTIANKAILHYSLIDARLSFEFHSLVQDFNIMLSTDATIALSAGLAQIGYVDIAHRYLLDRRLSVYQRADMLIPILQKVARHSREALHPQFTNELGQSMFSIFSESLPPDDCSTSLELVLLAMARRYPSYALSIIERIAYTHPSYFRALFFSHLLRALLEVRQFRLAKRLSDMFSKLQPQNGLAWKSMLLMRLFHGGASRLADRLAKRGGDSINWRSPPTSFARMIGFRQSPPTRVLTLKIPALLTEKRASDVSSSPLGIHLLIRAGRMRAAKQLYDRTRNQLSSNFQTIMGNDILHSTLQRRTGRSARELRKVLAVLADLVENRDFVPDRVTINILVKAILRWRTVVNSQQVRALFDNIIRNGYPAGNNANLVPFSSEASSPFKLPVVATPIDFDRHVRPLYKMFIRAMYERGDLNGASVIIGILKTVKGEVTDNKEQQVRTRMNRWLRSSRRSKVG